MSIRCSIQSRQTFIKYKKISYNNFIANTEKKLLFSFKTNHSTNKNIFKSNALDPADA